MVTFEAVAAPPDTLPPFGLGSCFVRPLLVAHSSHTPEFPTNPCDRPREPPQLAGVYFVAHPAEHSKPILATRSAVRTKNGARYEKCLTRYIS